MRKLVLAHFGAFLLVGALFFNKVSAWNYNKGLAPFQFDGRAFEKQGKDSDVHLRDFTREALNDSKKFRWFRHSYDSYKPAPSAIDSLRNIKDHVKIIVIGGSWCSDTKKLLPAFYKTVEQANISQEKITLIGVDRHKSSHGRGSGKYHITNVPTFILFYDNKEIGRIIESVQVSIEEDMINIFRQKL